MTMRRPVVVDKDYIWFLWILIVILSASVAASVCLNLKAHVERDLAIQALEKFQYETQVAIIKRDKKGE